MARRPREDEPDSWHHVVNRAIAKRPYFETRGDQRYFLSRLGREVREGRIEVHAYCLMTTHFHLLLRSPIGELSEGMRRVQCSYSRYFNRLRKRDGPLIRARFFSKRARTDLYRRTIVSYIDANPVRACLVEDSAAYEFGSARAYAGGETPPWLSRGWVEQRALELTANERFSPQAYRRAFGTRSGQEVESLCSLIEQRMGSASDLDPFDDLVGSAAHEVRSWMRRKALLADGHEVGLPICGVAGLARAIDSELARRGEWLIERGGKVWRGSELARVGLLRSLCSMPWSKIAGVTGWTVHLARRRGSDHVAALREGDEHAFRVERIAASALERTLAIGA